MEQINEQPDVIGTLDHERHNEYVVFGPPGCGKSTHLSRQVHRAAQRYGEHSVLCTSFSRAAAAELVGRGLPIPKEAVGTLHAHCYRALNSPNIAEGNVEEWNKEHPELRIKGQAGEDGEVERGEDPGTYWLGELSRARARMLPTEAWSTSLRRFEGLWSEYKSGNDLMDYTDLIETALDDVRFAPGNPSVIFADEAQDFTKLEFSLVRQWGSRAEYFVVAGDDDQCIYSGLTGASPLPLIENGLPESHKITLKQSYRVPRAVQAAAEVVIGRVASRQPKAYIARDEEGAVNTLAGHDYRHPGDIVDHVQGRLDTGASVMLLASCAYMLSPLITILRERGIPYHNPYRSNNGYWNPLRRDDKSAGGRLLALLGPHPQGRNSDAWTFRELQLWTEWLQSTGILRRGTKRLLTASAMDVPVTLEDLTRIFEEKALDDLLAAFESDAAELIEWWANRVTSASRRGSATYAAQIARARGISGLVDVPKVVVGTIHSVKGGEADHVYLFPDMSRAGWSQYENYGEQRDAITRLYYVGMTRARKGLVWVDSASRAAFEVQE